MRIRERMTISRNSAKTSILRQLLAASSCMHVARPVRGYTAELEAMLEDVADGQPVLARFRYLTSGIGPSYWEQSTVMGVRDNLDSLTPHTFLFLLRNNMLHRSRRFGLGLQFCAQEVFLDLICYWETMALFSFILDLLLQHLLGWDSPKSLNDEEYQKTNEKHRLLQEEQAERSSAVDTEWPNDLGFDTVREERHPIDLPVQGHIPWYAAGTIYRNGPGARQIFDNNGNLRYSVSHWFDGLAQLHKFDLLPGSNGIDSVRYASRFQVDGLMEELRQTGRFDGYTFAQKRDPCMSLFRKVMCLFTPVLPLSATTTNVSVTVSANPVGYPDSGLSDARRAAGHKAGSAQHIIARTDNQFMKAIDAETLEPIGIAEQKGLNPLLKGPLSATHARSDPNTGDVFNYNLDMGREATYRVFKTSASTGDTEILATIAAPDVAPAYMHSFFLSENFVILAVWSAHLMAGGLRVLWEKNMLDAIAPFDESKTTKWFVVDRRYSKGVVAQFESRAAFCFHTINAYEQTSINGTTEIICDFIEYGNLDILHTFYYENLRSSSPTATPWPNQGHRYARYQLSLPPFAHLPYLSQHQREQKCSLPIPLPAHCISSLTAGVGDMPNINPKSLCRPYRYFWNGALATIKSVFFGALTKVDTVTGETLRWQVKGHTPGEAIFVPDPQGTEEDDGILLTVVLDGFEGTSYLLCLDAKTMEELGKADCKGPLPFMFHGQHVRASGERGIDV